MRLVFNVLKGKSVNLKIMEREELPTLQEWSNNPEVMGAYEELRQETKTELKIFSISSMSFSFISLKISLSVSIIISKPVHARARGCLSHKL
jgi:hypothetical protein